jgi:DNA-binding HxlR family transcriptional regulator
MSATVQQITWLSDPGEFAGEIGASLAISGERWQASGASFVRVADGSGERPRLAVASIETTEGETRFGVLDYGEDATYLLVPSFEERAALTASVLSALKAVGWLAEEDVIDDSQGFGAEANVTTPVEGSGGLLLNIDGKIVPNYAVTMVSFEEGDVVKGKVIRIDKDEVLVDIGYKAKGVIPAIELSIRESVDPHGEVELGEEIDALVLTKEDAEGRLILSKKRARLEKAWRRIEAAAKSGEPVEGTVIEVVKGGLILDLGVRGFLPASLVDICRVPNLDEFLGHPLECKVIELNRSRNNVVLSRRAVLEEHKEVREQILKFNEAKAGIELIGKRWMGVIICALAERPMRFGELGKAVPGISDRLLSLRLRELEEEGLVRREVEAATPITAVTYSLSVIALELVPVIREINVLAGHSEKREKPALPIEKTSVDKS